MTSGGWFLAGLRPLKRTGLLDRSVPRNFNNTGIELFPRLRVLGIS
jgi:hypothetical protein